MGKVRSRICKGYFITQVAWNANTPFALYSGSLKYHNFINLTYEPFLLSALVVSKQLVGRMSIFGNKMYVCTLHPHP